MMLGRYRQQPQERIKRLVDYQKWLEPGEELQTVDATITPATTPPLQCSNILVEPYRFAYFIEGGVDGVDYMVEFLVTTQFQRREDEVEIEVEEI